MKFRDDMKEAALQRAAFKNHGDKLDTLYREVR